MKGAAFLVPVREGHYDLRAGTSGIDKRLMGICTGCLVMKNDFQRDNTHAVDPDNPHLVYRVD